MKLEWHSVFAVLLMVVLVGLVRAEDAKEVVIASAKELKGIKAKKITWKKDGAKMVRIPEKFVFVPSKTEPAVYDDFGDLIKAETVIPEGMVKVGNAFFMDTCEVTVGQFKKFLKSSGYKPPVSVIRNAVTDREKGLEFINWNKVYKFSSTDKHPMIYVSWHDATAYAKWVGKRLPTESEWVFAARGGLVGKKFPWGDDKSVAGEYANFADKNAIAVLRQMNSDSRHADRGVDDGFAACAPVGSLKPNGYGLFDMSGNVWEWCWDWYDRNKVGYEDDRVLQGGGWDVSTDYLRIGIIDPRQYDYPTGTGYYLGFRCVADLMITNE